MRLQVVQIPQIAVGSVKDRGCVIVFDEAEPDQFRDVDLTEFKESAGIAGILAFTERVDVVDSHTVVEGVKHVSAEQIAEALR